MIPKNPPPQLDSMFSKTFKEFVSFCLQRDPRDVSLDIVFEELIPILYSAQPLANYSSISSSEWQRKPITSLS